VDPLPVFATDTVVPPTVIVNVVPLPEKEASVCAHAVLLHSIRVISATKIVNLFIIE